MYTAAAITAGELVPCVNPPNDGSLSSAATDICAVFYSDSEQGSMNHPESLRRLTTCVLGTSSCRMILVDFEFSLLTSPHCSGCRCSRRVENDVRLQITAALEGGGQGGQFAPRMTAMLVGDMCCAILGLT